MKPLPLRPLVFATMAVLIGACSSTSSPATSDRQSATSVSQAAATADSIGTGATAESAGTVGPAAIAVNLDTVAAVLCEDAPERMSADAEVFTDSSFNCTHAGEGVRIDFYESADQQVTANQAVRDFYASTGDNRELSELPMGCGDLWGFGVDFNETRDALIDALSQAGIEAALC